MESPYVGTKFRVTGVFSITATSTVTNTTEIKATVRHPSTTEDTYSTGDSVVVDTTGTYYVDVLPDVDGRWIIGMGSTGTVCAYNEVEVQVLPRRA